VILYSIAVVNNKTIFSDEVFSPATLGEYFESGNYLAAYRFVVPDIENDFNHTPTQPSTAIPQKLNDVVLVLLVIRVVLYAVRRTALAKVLEKYQECCEFTDEIYEHINPIRNFCSVHHGGTKKNSELSKQIVTKHLCDWMEKWLYWRFRIYPSKHEPEDR
jgi:hypothetical protein